MRFTLSLITLIVLLTGQFNAQVRQKSDPKKSSATESAAPEEQQGEVLKISTALVTLPVIVSDRNDLSVPDLKKEEFLITEDGVKQEVAFFAETKAPFHVVLMIDTSGSTQEKLRSIQSAALAFVEQLQPQDRLRVISFDDEVRDLCEFTGDHAALRQAIEKTRAGQGTKLYDAVRLAISMLQRVPGRKAIVIFTDGVDWHSDAARYDSTIELLEEAGVIVYPIRYDTRAETEQLVRRQQQAGEVADLGTIFGKGNPRGRTGPTVPGGDPLPGGSGGSGGRNDPYKLPIPPIIIQPPYPGRYPGGTRGPDDRYPDRYPDRLPPDRFPDGREPRPDERHRRPEASDPDPRRSDPRRNDSISGMLDSLYRTADSYLQDLAIRSGGKLHRADTLGSLPEAFANIAAELRTQYSLGFYPTNTASDGRFRKLQVTTTRKGVYLRTQPGYRAARNTK